MKASLKQKRPFFYATIIGFIVLGGVIYFKMKNKEENKFAFTPPAVTVSAAVFGPVAKYINAIGTLRPFESVVIKSEVNAKVEKIAFSEGVIVKENDLLIELDEVAAKAQLMEAEAQYRKAKSEFEPTEKLADKGVMARTKRDAAKADMDMTAARVSHYKNILEKHKIYAPFGGIVSLSDLSKGQFVSVGNELVKIVDCHPLKVDFKVTEEEIEKIYVEQEMQVSIGGDVNKVFTAKITAIDPESEKSSHSFEIRGTLDVPEDVALSSQILKPGRFVGIKIPMDGDQQGIVVPESALEKIGEEDTLYRVVEGVAIRTLVTTGTRRDGNVEIITGVNEGELIITSGQAGVLDGKEVSIKSGASTSDVVKAVEEIRKQQQNASHPKSAAKGK
ncbi:MAG: efflux RND transporter periplasmic adaptor subunit [Holosporaceae bacterium]|nr:efflux RND transporter periplasmic adaptor subunit [Holosporaceae bacterium]